MANWIVRFLTAIATHKADPNAHHSPGGLYGINVETLAGDKTLTPGTDKIYQYLDGSGMWNVVTLATVGATAGDRFIIRNNKVYDSNWYLGVMQAAVVLDIIYAGGIKEFIFDGTNWVSRGIGTGEDDNKKYNVAIGHSSQGYDEGVAVGFETDGSEKGVAIGKGAIGSRGGVGIGYGADGFYYGVAIGYGAGVGTNNYSIALGCHSKCERFGETSTNIAATDTTQKNNVVQGRWAGATANDTPLEIFCAGEASWQFTIRPNSVLAFKMTIVARDNVANEMAMYTVADGLIKRDGVGNTVMVSCTVTVVHEDDAAWDVAVTADDVNEALIITVTGDDTNPTQWAAVMDGVETHF